MARYVMPSKDSLHDLFLRFDKDNSGGISARELQQALTHGSWKPFDMKTVKMMIDMFDKDGCGTINFEEFSLLWEYITDWQNLFRAVDQNNSGAIDRREFKDLLVQIGYSISDETLAKLMKQYSHSGTANVYLDAFIQCCISLHLRPETKSASSSSTSTCCPSCCII